MANQTQTYCIQLQESEGVWAPTIEVEADEIKERPFGSNDIATIELKKSGESVGKFVGIAGWWITGDA